MRLVTTGGKTIALLLFLIGLELQPSRLWSLRKTVFGLGAAQVLTTAALLSAAVYLLGASLSASVIIGTALSFSSTAFVLQVLAEKGELRNVGDPVELAVRYNEQGADEMVFFDITASAHGRATIVDVIERTADQCFMPLTVGGGIRTVDDMQAMLRAGAAPA